MATAANLRGVVLAGWVQTVVTYVVLSSTAVVSIIAIFHVGGSFMTPLHLFGAKPLSGIQAIAFALFLFAAFEWVTTTAEEARGPKVITRALFLAPLLIWATSTLFLLGLSHLVPFAALHHSAYPQLLLGQAALGTVGELWMLAITVLTALNTFNGGFLVASRFIYAAAREGNLPPVLARLNLNAVPWVAVCTLATASALLAAVIFATGQWLLLVAVGATLEAGIYALASASLLILRRKEHRDRPFRLVGGRGLAIAGTIIFSVFSLATGLADPANSSHFSPAPLLVIVVLAAISALYVNVGVPRVQAATAARRAAAARPSRRPQRPSAPAVESDPTVEPMEP